MSHQPAASVAAVPLVDDLLRLARVPGPGTVLKNTCVLVVRAGDVVVKAHPAGTDEADLRRRLEQAERLSGLMLPPIGLERLRDRLVTIWPAGEPLTPDDLDTAPWEEGARLLAGLHAEPLPAGLPAAGGPERLTRAMTDLHAVECKATDPDTKLGEAPAIESSEGTAGFTRDLSSGSGGVTSMPSGPEAHAPVQAASAGATRVPHEIRAAYETLPRELVDPLTDPLTDPLIDPASPPRARALTHGDWHLGQIVRFDGRWLLIDPDDLGAGDPVWDLARPAAWFASGLLAPEFWDRFLSAYIDAGGCAVSHDNPWRELDLPARALTIQLAATAVATAFREGNPLDEVAEALASSCGRILDASRLPDNGDLRR